MSLVEDQSVVPEQPPVPLNLGEQNAVGHQLDQGRVAGLVGEAHRVADGAAQRGAGFVGNALRHGAGRQPARLGVPDGAADAAAEFQADLGQLRRLARSGLAGDDHHLVLGDGLGYFRAPVGDRQVRVGDDGHRRETAGDHALRRSDLFCDLLGGVAPQILQPTIQPRGVTDGQPIETVAQIAQLKVGHQSQDRW